MQGTHEDGLLVSGFFIFIVESDARSSFRISGYAFSMALSIFQKIFHQFVSVFDIFSYMMNCLFRMFLINVLTLAIIGIKIKVCTS